ncbi:hypothetical protein CJU94_16995 [Paraburkholderia aromaticivorans]|uniref:Uncharacterized protein n=1 Tax=Paraburkholderia aromaticivorans TaxID=2026199 RepID=A0A248VL31_9BURK|nr:hypothetical protein CJU94_16995 [Paraburkholderia aromaticivorans]
MTKRLHARWTADGRRQTADGRRQTADGRRQTADGRRQTADGRRQTADGRRQTADGRRRQDRRATERRARVFLPSSQVARPQPVLDQSPGQVQSRLLVR